MPLDCLDNYIGFRGLCNSADTPGSGLYISDLPNLGIRAFESFADQNNPTALATWERIYGRAQDNFQTDVLRVLSEVRSEKGEHGIHTHTVLNNIITGEIHDDEPDDIAASAQLKGVWFDVWGSHYMDFEVPEVCVYLKAANTVTIYILDTQTGRTLYTDSFTGAIGRNTFRINQSFWLKGARRQFFVCYDATGHDSFETTGNGVNQCVDCDYTRYMSFQPAISPVTLPLTKDLIDFTVDNAGGFIAFANLNCRIRNFICAHRDILANALRYKAAIEFIHEQFDDDSAVNPYVLAGQERLTERLNRYTEMYERELYHALNGIRVDNDGVCFECIQPINVSYSHP